MKKNQNKDLRTLWWLAFFSTLTMFGLMTWQPAKGANVSGINKTTNGVIVQGRDGTSSLLKPNGLPLYVQGTNYTITTTDGYEDIYVTAGASNRTITLPTVKGSFGRRIKVFKSDAGAGSVLMAVTDGSLVGPGSNVSKISGQASTMEFQCDGVNWYLKNLHDSGSFTATVGGVTGSVTPTWSYTRSGSTVTISPVGNGSFGNYYLNITKNGSSGNVTVTGFPLSIQPTQAVNWVSGCWVWYNDAGSPSGVGSGCDMYMDNAATLNISRDIGGDGFGSATQSAIHFNNYTYDLI